MSAGIVTGFTGTLLLLLSVCTKGYSQDAARPPVRIMFYNVENLFDTSNDSLTQDDEFLPGGLRRWNSKRYYAKISSVFKTIIAAGEWTPPALIGLCEVENRKVLEDLIYGTNLSRFDYGIVHKDSPDPRGIDVCLIYRKDIVNIDEIRFMQPCSPDSGNYATRYVLYARCIISGDTINLFLNHWPSRRGGVLAGESQRFMIAEMVKTAADSLNSLTSGRSKIILMGDFNSIPDDGNISIITGSYPAGKSMINLATFTGPDAGSYRYQGTWELIDQIIVSGFLLQCKEGIYTEPGFFRIFKPEFLMIRDPVYPGMSPFSTYRGYTYQGGYSDHLPVLLDLKFR